MATESKLILTAEDRTAAAWASLKQQGEKAYGAVKGAAASTAATLATTFAGVFGGLAVTGIYASFVAQTVEANGTIKDLQESFGATLDGLSQIRAGAAISGKSLAEMEDPINKLAKSLAESSDASSDSARAIKALGLNLDDIRKMSPDQALIAVAKASQDFANGTNKAAVITALFGREGAKLIPVLNDIAEAEGKYLKLTQEQIDASDEFDKNIKRLNLSFSDFKTEIGNSVIPALSEVIEFTRRAQREYGSFLGLVVGGVGGGALKLFGVDLDEMKRAETEVSETFARLTKARQELFDQKALKAKGLGIGFVIDNNIKNAEEQIAKETAALKAAIKARDAVAASRANGGAPKQKDPDFSPNAPKETKPKVAKEREDLNAGQDITAAQAYARAMDAIGKAQDTAGNAGRTLTAAQQALFDLMRSPEWERMPQVWRDVVIEQTAVAVEAEEAAAKTKRLNELLAATDSSRLEATRADMQLLAQALEDGTISAQQFEEAATKALGNVADKGRSDFDELLSAIEGWGRDASKSLAKLAMEGRISIKSLGDVAGQVIEQFVAMSIQKQLMDPIFKAGAGALGGGKDAAGGGFDIMSLLSKGASAVADFDYSGLFAKAVGALPSFDVGTPYVIQGGMARIHPGEAILTAAENAARLAAPASGGQPSVTNNFNFAAPTDRRTQQQLAAAAYDSTTRAARRGR